MTLLRSVSVRRPRPSPQEPVDGAPACTECTRRDGLPPTLPRDARPRAADDCRDGPGRRTPPGGGRSTDAAPPPGKIPTRSPPATSPATASTSASHRPSGQMNRWLESSPFLAVGIYISGDSRGCRSQPNLTPTWIGTQLHKGWRLLPITLGPQASCHPGFPRYGDDPTINGRSRGANALTGRPDARAAEAATAVDGRQGARHRPAAARSGTTSRASTTPTGDCRESALSFLSAWTNSLHALDYVSGVYSSAGSGHQDARRRPGRAARARTPSPTGSGSPAGTARPNTVHVVHPRATDGGRAAG